ncbi:MAG: hypothetical protein JSV29_01055 [Candidatus Bathyarchaeota archaeon]|nr:MAG: hypothetical protein JSV29_01055 [Candidatus Bathyarchaeota archaeon]
MPKKKNTSRRSQRRFHNYIEPSTAEGWSARRVSVFAQEKIKMARHFALHDLFVKEEQNPGYERENRVAKIIVNPGTTTNEVVNQVLEWVKNEAKNNPKRAAPEIMWYTPGSLVLGTLRDFRLKHHRLRNSCGLHMFPGKVDPDLEMVRGDATVKYVKSLGECFTYAILSPYTFDMNTGTVFTFFEDELELQRAIALCEAEHKFLFLDPDKFKREGSKVYVIRELLETSRTATIYTVSSKKDPIIRNQFSNLTEVLLDTKNKRGPHRKILRLVIVNKEKQVNIPIEGELKAEDREQTDALRSN